MKNCNKGSTPFASTFLIRAVALPQPCPRFASEAVQVGELAIDKGQQDVARERGKVVERAVLALGRAQLSQR